jgi:NAD(P)-dependent dehydrogenase (short-subunit alcohol dehydrogenase family)
MMSAQPPHGRLAGKVALVTGAAPRSPGVGNGSAVATLFAREGATVVLVNRSIERAEALKTTIEQAGGRCLALAADVTQEDQVKAVMDTLQETFGRLDILHNNVGFGGKSRIQEIQEPEWQKVLNGNLTSILWTCKYGIPLMCANGGGSIINVSSIAGAIGLRDPSVGLIAYSTAKAGVIGLSRSLAAENAALGIRVNCIVVGMVDTPMVAKLSDEARAARTLGVPLRTEGTGWDVAWAAVYLASDESRWITGIDLPIDAGFMRIVDRPG